MPLNPQLSRQALKLLSEKAIRDALLLIQQLEGTPSFQRAVLIDQIQSLIGYYAEGSTTLAVDLYDELRDRANITSRFITRVGGLDRQDKIRNALAWASQPLLGEDGKVAQRVTQIVRREVFRPFRETILENSKVDQKCLGWRRVLHAGACSFCQMLAGRGAVYKESTAFFVAHSPKDDGRGGSCECGAEPVFISRGAYEASEMQYLASRKGLTKEQRERVQAYAAEHYPAH